MDKLQERGNYLVDRGRAYGKKGDLAMPKMACLAFWKLSKKVPLIALNNPSDSAVDSLPIPVTRIAYT